MDLIIDNEQNLSKEDQLLIYCARITADLKFSKKIAALARFKLDWKFLLKKAGRHKLVPLLHLNLNLHARELVPPYIFVTLQKHVTEIAIKNFLLTAELAKIVNLLKKESITPISFKGPTLAALAYKDIALRQFGDLDIFIKRKYLPQAHEALSANGYKITDELKHINFKLLTRTLHQKNFYTDVLHLDVHWQLERQELFNRFLYSERINVDLDYCKVDSFAIENQILLLSIHCADHRWERLASLCDIALLCENFPDLNWTTIIEKSNRLHLKKILATTFYLIKNLLEFEISEEMQSLIAAIPSAKKLAFYAMKKTIFAELPLSLSDKAIFIIRRNDNVGRGLKQLLYFLVKPTEKEFNIVLPGPLTFLYFVLRPIFLIKQFF